MILRRVIDHFRKQETLPLIPAKAGTQCAARRHAKMGPGFRRDERG